LPRRADNDRLVGDLLRHVGHGDEALGQAGELRHRVDDARVLARNLARRTDQQRLRRLDGGVDEAEHRERKGARLAGAVLRLRNQMLARLDDDGQRRRLNARRPLELHRVHALEQLGREIQFGVFEALSRVQRRLGIVVGRNHFELRRRFFKSRAFVCRRR
jgi:hypothetical protein